MQCLQREVEARGGRRELKERALHHVRELLPKIPDPIRAELLLQEAAAAFHVPERLLRADRPTAPAEPLARLEQEDGRRAELERTLLRLGMASRKARAQLSTSLTPEDFHFDRMRSVFERLSDLPDTVDRVRDGDLPDLDEAEERLLARLLIEMPEPELDAAAELTATLDSLREFTRREQAMQHRRRLDEAYRSGDDWREQWNESAAASGDDTARPTRSAPPAEPGPEHPERGGSQPQ